MMVHYLREISSLVAVNVVIALKQQLAMESLNILVVQVVTRLEFTRQILAVLD